MTTRSFEEQLAEVSGKVRRVNMWNDFDRFHDGLLYYWNNAERLRDSAKILWSAAKDDVALMLAGLSIELLLKGTILGLQGAFPHCHQLECLIATAGISVDERGHNTSKLLTEFIVWAARYPTPKEAEDWFLEETGGWPLARAAGRWQANEEEEYECLWNTLAPYFWQVYESTHESAELDENDFGKLKERPKRPHQHATRRQS